MNPNTANTIDSALIARYKLGGDLSPGDILLTTMRRSAVSAAIRTATASSFSHAALYRGEWNVLEAIGVGVTNYSILRRGFVERRNVQVLRLRKDIENRRELISRALARAEYYRGRGYWTTGAIASGLLGARHTDSDGRMFCSHFVAQVYNDVGLPLLENKIPHTVTPQALAHSTQLEDVTDSVLVDVPDWQTLADPLEPQDFERADSPNDQSLQFERELLVIASQVLGAKGYGGLTKLDDVFRVLIVEVSAEHGKEIDSMLASIFAAPRFTQAADWAVPNTYRDSVGPALSAASPIALQEALGQRLQLLEKWLTREQDYVAEVVAGAEVFRRTGFLTIECLLLRTRSKLAVLRSEVSALRLEIDRISQLISRGDSLHL